MLTNISPDDDDLSAMIVLVIIVIIIIIIMIIVARTAQPGHRRGLCRLPRRRPDPVDRHPNTNQPERTGR
jgi:hypothetical protein